MTGPRVVVIGAGAVGCAVADELTQRGWTDVTLVDRDPLFHTLGSTAHAPGLVSRTSPSRMMHLFAEQTISKFQGLSHRDGPCLLDVGALEVALTEERLAELQRRSGLASSWGFGGRMLTAQECVADHPLLDGALVKGGYRTEGEGIAKAVRAAEAQAGRAASRGARVVGGTRVVGTSVRNGRVISVETDQGPIPADVVICCAGAWGPVIADYVGMTLPMLPTEHQYAITNPVAALAAHRDQDASLPFLRHHDAGIYLRNHGDRIGIGSYNHRVRGVDPSELDQAASREASVLVRPFTPEDFRDAFELARELMPALRGVELDRAFNGIFSFTPDGFPLIGPSPDVEGFWVAESAWITHSVGVARACVEWIMNGAPEIAVHEADVARFQPWELRPSTWRPRAARAYREVFRIHSRDEPYDDPGGLQQSPFHEREVELGAVYADRGARESPLWFGINERDASTVPLLDRWSRRWWSPAVISEQRAARERVGLFDMTTLARIEVEGVQAAEWLDRMISRRVAEMPVGRVAYSLLLDDRGRIRSDLTVTRLGLETFQIGTNGPLDLAWLRAHLPRDGSVAIKDLNGITCTLGLWGPRAREVLQTCTDADISNDGFRYFTARDVMLKDVRVWAFRMSYAGELGWEFTTTPDRAQRLWDVLWAAGRPLGIAACGRKALAALRIESGYRAWGLDVTTDHLPEAAGLDGAVTMGKPYFIGKDALLNQGDQPRRLVCLRLTEQDAVPTGGEPVVAPNGGAVGYVTTAEYGLAADAVIALAWVDRSQSSPGSALRVLYFGRDLSAMVVREPVVPADQRSVFS